MRIPDSLAAQRTNTHITQATDRLARLQEEASSGKRILRPSDDPMGAVRADQLRSGLTCVANYQTTVNEAQSWLKTEDTVIGQVSALLRQANTLGLQGATVQSTENRQAISAQIDSIAKGLVEAGNAKAGGRYLFGGFRTTTVPFVQENGIVAYRGDQGVISATVGDDVSIVLNHTGATLFNMDAVDDPNLPDTFTTISRLAEHIRTGDQSAVQTDLQALAQHMERVGLMRGDTGTRLQQLNAAADTLAQSKLLLTDLLGNTESVDLASALIEMKTQENVYQAASYVASTLGRGGLINWLR